MINSYKLPKEAKDTQISDLLRGNYSAEYMLDVLAEYHGIPVSQQKLDELRTKYNPILTEEQRLEFEELYTKIPIRNQQRSASESSRELSTMLAKGPRNFSREDSKRESKRLSIVDLANQL